MNPSEKAKGKQRAVELPLDAVLPQTTVPEPQLDVTRELVIRFTEGILDLYIRVGQRDQVRDIKSSIREARPELKDRRLRLIHSGRLLTEGVYLYAWLESLEERQKRATSKDAEVSGQPAQAATTWLHCSVGPKIEQGVEEDGEGKAQTAQLQPARGFDRLASVGFSESDIANFRQQFHSQSSNNFLDEREFENEEDYHEHARALEEQWIDSMDTPGTASLSQGPSSNSSVMQGVLAGFFFPLMPFFFMRKPTPAIFWEDGVEHQPPDSVIFSKSMQIGLVVGFMANVLFGVWRFLLDSS